LGGKGSGRPKKHKNLKNTPTKNYTAYQKEYHQKRRDHELDSFLSAAKAMAPPKPKKGKEWSF